MMSIFDVFKSSHATIEQQIQIIEDQRRTIEELRLECDKLRIRFNNESALHEEDIKSLQEANRIVNEYNHVCKERDELRARLERADADAAAMRELLCDFEHMSTSSCFVYYCPCCGEFRTEPHKPNCRMRIALSNRAGAALLDSHRHKVERLENDVERMGEALQKVADLFDKRRLADIRHQDTDKIAACFDCDDMLNVFHDVCEALESKL